MSYVPAGTGSNPRMLDKVGELPEEVYQHLLAGGGASWSSWDYEVPGEPLPEGQRFVAFFDTHGSESGELLYPDGSLRAWGGRILWRGVRAWTTDYPTGSHNGMRQLLSWRSVTIRDCKPHGWRCRSWVNQLAGLQWTLDMLKVYGRIPTDIWNKHGLSFRDDKERQEGMDGVESYAVTSYCDEEAEAEAKAERLSGEGSYMTFPEHIFWGDFPGSTEHPRELDEPYRGGVLSVGGASSVGEAN